MNLSWQLLKVFRRGLWICLGVEVVLVFLIAMNDIRPQSPESVLDSFGVSFLLAMILSLCLRIRSRLSRMPFPVSAQQQVWLSSQAFVILWGSGVVTMFAAILFFDFSPAQWLSLGGQMFLRLPFYVLAFLFVYRLMQSTPHLIGLIFFMFFLPRTLNAYDNSFWVSWYYLALPVALGMIVFYWIEIPKQLASQDRLLIAQGHNQPVTITHDLNIDTHQTVMIWSANTINAACFLALFLWMLSGTWSFMWGRSQGFSVQGFVSRPWLILFPVVAVFFTYVLLREAYRRAVSSGFHSHSSVWLTLLQMTIVLGPLAQALGVKKGCVAQCDQCRMSKFVWALHCPHCGFAGPGTFLNKQMVKLARQGQIRITTRQKVIFRLFIPLQILIMGGMFSMVSNRAFEAHTLLLNFQDAQTAAMAVLPVQDWIEAQAATEPVLASQGLTAHVPAKYRAQVVYYQGNGYMTMEAYGLRWDSAGQLPAILADHLGETLKGRCTFTTVPIKQRDASSPFMQTRTYLDNKVHWVERENSAPRKNSHRIPRPPLEKPVKKMPPPPPKRVE